MTDADLIYSALLRAEKRLEATATDEAYPHAAELARPALIALLTLREEIGRGLADDGDIFGVEGRGKRGFYMKRGGVSYPISAKVAALELSMKG